MAGQGTFDFWITDRLSFTIAKGGTGSFDTSITDRIAWPEYVSEAAGDLSISESDGLVVTESDAPYTDDVLLGESISVSVSGGVADLSIAIVTSDQDYWLAGIRVVTP